MRKKGVVWCVVIGLGLFWCGHNAAQAGIVKVHQWPCVTLTEAVSQSICDIDVLISVGYYIHLTDQDVILVGPDSSSGDPWHCFAGYKSAEIFTNFSAHLSVSIVPSGPNVGQWGASVSPEDLSPGQSIIKIFVQGSNVDIQALAANAPQRVATVTLSVVPR